MTDTQKGFGLAPLKSEGAPRPAGRTILGGQEITPAMIEAGVDVLTTISIGSDPGDNPHETVRDIFEAMTRAREGLGD